MIKVIDNKKVVEESYESLFGISIRGIDDEPIIFAKFQIRYDNLLIFVSIGRYTTFSPFDPNSKNSFVDSFLEIAKSLEATREYNNKKEKKS